jgi:hypothetical protein
LAADFVKKLTEKFQKSLKQIFCHCGLQPNEGLDAFIRRYSRYVECFYVSCPGLDRRQIEKDRELREFLQNKCDRLALTEPDACRNFKSVLTRLHETAEKAGKLASSAPAIPFRVKFGQPLVQVLGVVIPMVVMALYVLAIGPWPTLSDIAQKPLILAAVGLVIATLAYRLVSAGTGLLVSALLIFGILASAAGAAAISQILPYEAFMASRFALLGLAVVAGTIASELYRLELLERDDEKNIQPGWMDVVHMRDVCQDENSPDCMQNHFVNLSVVKGGSLRFWTLALMLRFIHFAGIVYFNKGKLGGIPSIHFARWVILKRGEFGDDPLLLFMTNYDSSWDSYLGDFVDEASEGVSGIWSNTVGFPRTWLLVCFGGSRFEKQFKAYARKGQQRSLAWFAAYPNVSVPEKLSNSDIRRALDKMNEKIRRGIGKKPVELNIAEQDDLLRRL